jgi:hypothetical protein
MTLRQFALAPGADKKYYFDSLKLYWINHENVHLDWVDRRLHRGGRSAAAVGREHVQWMGRVVFDAWWFHRNLGGLQDGADDVIAPESTVTRTRRGTVRYE